ncbi:MAG: hypothetical protein J7501_04795 [Bdellovibrio sp.]|nr:hypothetical protein [Bdellovibrio sp.]
MKFFWAALLVAFSTTAEARVFDMNRDSVAPYFNVTGGASMLSDSAYKLEATGVSTDSEVKYNYSGEFGFLLSRRLVGLRFGIEILKPQSLDNITGKNAGGVAQYTASSSVLGFVPKIALDLNLNSTPAYRSFISLAAGYADVTLKNEHTMTAAGNVSYPGVDTTLESKGTGTLLAATLGYEGVLSDTTTYVFEFGYRQLKIDKLKYSKDYKTFNGNVSSGDTVKMGSENRVLDLSGGYISLGFRFYM